MDEYVEIQNSQFQYLKVGDYIRWHTEDAINIGGTITQVGKSKNGHYNWRIKGFNNYEITMYWDKVSSVFVRKSIWYELLEKRINILSSVVNFLIKELDLQDQFNELKITMQKSIAIEDNIKQQKVKSKRRSKSVGQKKNPRF